MYRVLIMVLLVAGCDPGNTGLGVDAGSIDATAMQGSEATAELIINEVAAQPTSGADWLELYNRSSEAVNLCDYFVTDSLDRLDHYLHLGAAPPPQLCVPRLLQAGEYLVIYADDDVLAGIDHAPFKLGLADQAHVVSTRGEAIDSLIFLHARDDEGLSLARVPNGEGEFWVSDSSQGEANPWE